jgi:tetratricopeptide (TPR) repeat protein
LLETNGKTQDAEDARRRLIDFYEKLAIGNSKMPEPRDRLARSHYTLAEMLAQKKRPQEAIEEYRQAIAGWEKLAADFRDKPEFRVYTARMAVVLSAVNNTAWRLATDANPANRDPGWAVELAKLAVERAPGNGVFANTLGAAQYRAGDWKEAIAALEKSMQLRQGGDSFDWFLLAMAHWQLGDKEKARR